MNREIKFRAWYKSRHINTKKEEGQDFYVKKWSMGKVHTIHLNKNKVMVNGVTGVISVPIGEECQLMQYTGLKDKNGREIYEGDIISDDDTFRWKVFWEDGAFHAKGGEFGLQEHLIEFHPDFCEVIGNIYENTDLLQP